MPVFTKVNSPLSGSITARGDKSISHRSIMTASLAQGTTEIHGFYASSDCMATVNIFRALGVNIEETNSPSGEHIIKVQSKGLYGLKEPSDVLYAGNSATSARLITGILAAQAFHSKIEGDGSLNKRTMKRIIDPLNEMGANISSENGDNCCPLIIKGSRLYGIDYKSPAASAQLKSALLFAALYAEGETVIEEPFLSRDHTERMFKRFNVNIYTEYKKEEEKSESLQEALHIFGKKAKKEPIIRLIPGNVLRSDKIIIPGDFSSAAYLMTAALLIPGSEIVLKNVGINETRTGFWAVLKEMGADIDIISENKLDEPAADLKVKYSALSLPESGLIVEGSLIPALIDELPLIAVVAACCTGGMIIIKDAADLKTKESDRISATVQNLMLMGADITETEDGMIVRGGKKLHSPMDKNGNPAEIKTFGDHRIAMAFAVLSLCTYGNTLIDDTDCVSVSYPDFFRDLMSLM